MRVLFLLGCFCLISCSTLESFKKSDQVKQDWELKKRQIQQESTARKEAEAKHYHNCEKIISECELKTEKEDLLNCQNSLKSCDYDFSMLKNDYGREQVVRIRSIEEKCYTYGYEKADYGKMPKNAVVPWIPSNRGHGNYKNLDECIEASSKDEHGQSRNSCVRRDWCKDQNSLVFKEN